jgi:hypothetical protein
LVIFAGVEKIGEFDDQLRYGFIIHLASPIPHILLQCFEAAASDFRPLANVVAQAGEKLAMAFDQGSHFGAALETLLFHITKCLLSGL